MYKKLASSPDSCFMVVLLRAAMSRVDSDVAEIDSMTSNYPGDPIHDEL